MVLFGFNLFFSGALRLTKKTGCNFFENYGQYSDKETANYEDYLVVQVDCHHGFEGAKQNTLGPFVDN